VAQRVFAHICLGGGRASAETIDTLLKAGVSGKTIALVGAERELPYNRPPLSKGYLLERESRDSLFVKPAAFYAEKKVSLFLNARALAVDPAARTVALDDGHVLEYETLLIATGSTPRRLSVPGENLPGIFTLRTVGDSEQIRRATETAKTAVVVGGGFIGMELASAFAQKGIRTTILHRGTAVFDKLGSPEASAFFAKYYEDRGVTIRYEDAAVGFEGDARVSGVRTKKGETLPADLVGVGVGVVPDIAFLQGSGITMENGVKVNEYLEASAPGVYAAGDVASFFDPLYERHRRIEHWDTAIQHGRVAGKNMAGKHEPYAAVSYFFSDIFDLSFDYFGDAEGTDTAVLRGTFESGAVTVFYLKDSVAHAACMMGRPKERNATIALIKQRTQVDAPALQAVDMPLPTPSR
jgi:NADPH-dependent 2,4-dienoyl-CoA reductase/sulfur reductase-like enzyme